MGTQDQSPPRGLARRLVLCLDGTWNTDDGRSVTNIVEIRDRISPSDKKGVEQKIYYDQGIGTGLGLDRLTGGAFGAGMENKVRAAYRFLSANYIDTDDERTEILIFGFSRGAYTARALTGFVGAAGLLRPEHCNRENEDRVWNYYRTAPKERLPADRVALQNLLFPSVRIQCLGVFDTVGALGIPMRWFMRLNRWRYEFHDTELGSNVDVALQALAIDEKRCAFQPSVWSKPPHAGNRHVEQVWFPGVHSNIGGGYKDGRLSQIALNWMLTRVQTLKLGLALDRPPDTGADEQLVDGEIYESRKLPTFMSDYFHPAFRKIINLEPKGGRYRPVGLVPRGIVFNEFVHWTCLYLWSRSDDAKKGYRPPNLVLALDRVRATYGLDPKAAPGLPLYVVGKHSEILNPDNASDARQVHEWLGVRSEVQLAAE